MTRIQKGLRDLADVTVLGQHGRLVRLFGLDRRLLVHAILLAKKMETGTAALATFLLTRIPTPENRVRVGVPHDFRDPGAGGVADQRPAGASCSGNTAACSPGNAPSPFHPP